MSGKYLHHTACEHCGSSDANAVYDDGGEHCFSCGFHKGSKISGYVKQADTACDVIKLPDDLSYEYSQEALEWVKLYHLTAEDLIKHKVYFSKYNNQLVYVYQHLDHSGVGCYQARNFNKGAKKYYNAGSSGNVMPIYKAKEWSQTLILVEDAISAIRVSEFYDAMPVLGSSINLDKIARIPRMGYNHVIVWLDHDKYKEALNIEHKLNFVGITTDVICTDLDPKCYTSDIIKNRMNVL